LSAGLAQAGGSDVTLVPGHESGMGVFGIGTTAGAGTGGYGPAIGRLAGIDTPAAADTLAGDVRGAGAPGSGVPDPGTSWGELLEGPANAGGGRYWPRSSAAVRGAGTCPDGRSEPSGGKIDENCDGYCGSDVGEVGVIAGDDSGNALAAGAEAPYSGTSGDACWDGLAAWSGVSGGGALIRMPGTEAVALTVGVAGPASSLRPPARSVPSDVMRASSITYGVHRRPDVTPAGSGHVHGPASSMRPGKGGSDQPYRAQRWPGIPVSG
jgi:hypothetical protein